MQGTEVIPMFPQGPALQSNGPGVYPNLNPKLGGTAPRHPYTQVTRITREESLRRAAEYKAWKRQQQEQEEEADMPKATNQERLTQIEGQLDKLTQVLSQVVQTMSPSNDPPTPSQSSTFPADTPPQPETPPETSPQSEPPSENPIQGMPMPPAPDTSFESDSDEESWTTEETPDTPQRALADPADALAQDAADWIAGKDVDKAWRTVCGKVLHAQLCPNAWSPAFETSFREKFHAFLSDHAFLRQIARTTLSFPGGRGVSPDFVGRFAVLEAGFLAMYVVGTEQNAG